MIWLLDKILQLVLFLLAVLFVGFVLIGFTQGIPANVLMAAFGIWIVTAGGLSALRSWLESWRYRPPRKPKSPRLKRQQAINTELAVPPQPKPRALAPVPFAMIVPQRTQAAATTLPERLRDFITRGDDAILGGASDSSPRTGQPPAVQGDPAQLRSLSPVPPGQLPR